ncbi:UNVERIFIED_CONTAM: hypothetical protein K2H54_057391 [Gekko kuhli]
MVGPEVETRMPMAWALNGMVTWSDVLNTDPSLKNPLKGVDAEDCIVGAGCFDVDWTILEEDFSTKGAIDVDGLSDKSRSMPEEGFNADSSRATRRRATLFL